MLILLLTASMISTMTLPYLYLSHVRQRKIDDTVTTCREVVELVGAVNNHYMYFIKTTGEYIDFVEKKAVKIRLDYDKGVDDLGNIYKRQNMLADMAALTAGPDKEIKDLWSVPGTSLETPVGSESSASFISRLGLGTETNGNIGNSEALKAVTFRSNVISRVTSSTALSNVPQTWSVEMTITPKREFDIAILRKNLFEHIKTDITRNNECIKVSIVKAEPTEVIIKMEYTISGILKDNMSIFGM